MLGIAYNGTLGKNSTSVNLTASLYDASCSTSAPLIDVVTFNCDNIQSVGGSFFLVPKCVGWAGN